VAADEVENSKTCDETCLQQLGNFSLHAFECEFLQWRLIQYVEGYTPSRRVHLLIAARFARLYLLRQRQWWPDVIHEHA